MKRFILASLLLAAPALAQQPAYTPTSEVLLRQALSCENVASGQIAALQQQIATKDKEIADLKSKASPPPASTSAHQ